MSEFVTMSRALVLVLATSLAACARPPVATPVAVEPARPVRVARPQPAAANETLVAIGRLEAASQMRLGFRSAGLIAAIDVDIGDAVEAGQVLARQETAELDAAVSRASEAQRKAERDLQRARELAGRGLLPREAADNAATERESAAATLHAAAFAQRHGRIVAPAAGRVLERRAEPREVVSAGQTVLVVSSEANDWRLRVGFGDRDATRLAVGMAAAVQFDAWPERRFAGRIARIGAGAATATALYEVEIALDPGDAPLRSGLLGRVRIEVPREHGVLAVPSTALLRAEGSRGEVLLVREGRAVAVTVTLGRLYDGLVDVPAGLAADDQVVVGGGWFVDDGALVRVVDR